MVFYDRMARHVQHVAVLVVFEAFSSQCHTLIERYVVTDDTCFTNYHTRAVINGKVFTDSGTGMNVDTRFRVGPFRDDARNDGHLQFVQLVGDTIVCHSVNYWIAEYHLSEIRSSRIVVEHRLDIRIEQSFDFGQFVDKRKSQSVGLFVRFLLGGNSLTILTELQSVSYLLDQSSIQFHHTFTNMI